MAIKVTLSFKENNINDVTLYDFLEKKAETIGKSAYIKSLLKEQMDKEIKERQK
ncbi:hypothetical protein [Romboutsia timonensis]|uniref:hypothetical protein n=1 Tax=Romboutsia timonensis TaxID=1776391 RepID=UPI002A81CD57|nr:hypothetical protein [Romboutsia timonensis]MDY3960963.1 hypothetical protein [Romboutsia timonensis]